MRANLSDPINSALLGSVKCEINERLGGHPNSFKGGVESLTTEDQKTKDQSRKTASVKPF
jgi:hypothetical protein